MTLPYTVIANTKALPREEWLELRKDYIGGSDAGAVLGLSPFRSALDVYLDKTGEAREEDPTYKMHLGSLLEDTVATLFEEQTGKKVRKNYQMMVSTDYPWMLADIDREIVGEDAILECKTTSGWNKDQWEDEMTPLSYQIQVQHYMAVTGAQLAYVACMIGFEDFVIREIPRDEETIGLMVEGEKEFYDLLQDPDHPLPPPDGSRAYSQALDQKYHNPEESQSPIEIPFESDYYFSLCDQIKKLSEKKELYEQIIKNKMKKATKARADGVFISWKPVTSKRFDTKTFRKDHPDLFEAYSKESTYRRFSVKKIHQEEE